MKTIETIIQEHGGLAAVQNCYIRIENPPLMRLVIEVVAGPFPSGAYEVSVAHYGEQNGDAMRDPEITFLVVPTASGWAWLPLTFLNDYVGVFQIVAEYDDNGILQSLSPRLERDLQAFARIWNANIKEQGFLTAYRAQMRTANGPRTAHEQN